MVERLHLWLSGIVHVVARVPASEVTQPHGGRKIYIPHACRNVTVFDFDTMGAETLVGPGICNYLV